MSTRTEVTPPLLGGGLLRSLADYWWLLLLRGLVAIAFGVVAFVWPGLTLVALTLVWGAYALADGILALWTALAATGGETAKRWWLALGGVASVVAGLVAFFYTGMTALVLLMFIAAWAIVIGVILIWGAIELHKILDDAWLIGLNGALAVAFGVLLVARPGAGALAVVWMIGWFAVVFGILHIALAFRLRRFKQPA
ncbi:MAG TPA: HdeD family acid-resistance protein [Xanthobacteraceae bacterium]|nr:HdeD family acid-resistance protein [Xanthobacteraceae bacterium]